MFTIPLLSHHDPAQVEVFCYAEVRRADAATARIRGYAHQWRDIAGMADHAAADLIRRDQIDVLIDLSMHMGYNRLPIFAERPAPVQASWLAYPGSTGLRTIDYRISDRYLDLPDEEQQLDHERVLRLPDSFWCYDPLAASGEHPIGPLPVERNGYVTFGCLNNFCKVNVGVIDAWASVMRRVGNSRLLLLAPPGIARDRLLTRMKDRGVHADRIAFVAYQPREQYLNTFNRVDLCLETFPYNGHTTSLDAMWMGVATPTFPGKTAVGRAGCSILSSVGLQELIAKDLPSYLDLVVNVASDLALLSSLRSTLRERMQSSPLMDGQKFARGMESLYREAWTRYCISPSSFGRGLG